MYLVCSNCSQCSNWLIVLKCVLNCCVHKLVCLSLSVRIKVRSIQLDVLYSVDCENGEPAKTPALGPSSICARVEQRKKYHFAAECRIIISFRLNLSASSDWPVHWKGKNRFSPNNMPVCVCVSRCSQQFLSVNYSIGQHDDIVRATKSAYCVHWSIFVCAPNCMARVWNEKLKEKCNTQITTAAHIGSQANEANKWKWKGNREWAVKQCVITIWACICIHPRISIDTFTQSILYICT